MEVILLPSSCAREKTPRQFLTSYLINQSVALDAGSLGFQNLKTQQRVRHVLLSHVHFDHLASLPMFLINVYRGDGACVTVHATAGVLDALRRHVFNDCLWPDLSRLSRASPPYVKLKELHPRRLTTVAGLRITPIPVNHAVDCLGFLVQDADGTVAFSSDTGPTDEIWKHANRSGKLRGVFLEASLPAEMAWLAERAGHLTTAAFAAEVAKLPKQTRVLAVHLSARYHQTVARELRRLKLPNVALARPGVRYRF